MSTTDNKKQYNTPLEYVDGNGRKKRTKLSFRLDPIELMDWTFANPFEASLLQASLEELHQIEKEDSRDLTEKEVRTFLGLVKLLSELSYGRPDQDGEYFVKDPNWTSSYAYRGFRMFLMTHPKETQQFLNSLLDNDTMEKFSTAIREANDRVETESEAAPNRDSVESNAERMKAKIAEKEAEIERLKAQQS